MINAKEAFKKASESNVDVSKVIKAVSDRIESAANKGDTNIDIDAVITDDGTFNIGLSYKDRPYYKVVIDELGKNGFNVKLYDEFITVEWKDVKSEEKADDLLSSLKQINDMLRANSKEYKDLDDKLENYVSSILKSYDDTDYSAWKKFFESLGYGDDE